MSRPGHIPGAGLLPANDVGKRLPRRWAKRRAALAPVELVLSIPLVLMVTALSVIAGNAACWKIRAAVVARNEIWSNRKPRSDTPADPWPAGWPQSATMNHSGSRPLSDLNVAAFQNPLIRGPLPNVTVNSRLLDPTLSVRIGQDYIQRTPPVLPRLGDFSFNVEHPLIDGTWAYWQTGQWSNERLRFPDLYPNTPPQDLPEKAAFDAAVQGVVQFLSNGQLAVLDGDQELHDWYYPNTNPPQYMDFHPRTSFCSLDPMLVYARYVTDPRTGLLVRIAAVPRRITAAFISMYQQQLSILQNMMPPPPGVQAQIDALEKKIQILEDYRATLP